MRTEIFDPKNIQVCLRSNKYNNLVTVHILDLRLPAEAEVEIEETASYGPTPMYYADDCCMVSPAFIAQIVRETLQYHYNQYYYNNECHVYTPYSIQVDETSRAYHKKHQIHLHSGYDPAQWERPHLLEFGSLYRRAEKTIRYLMRDLIGGTFSLNEATYDYKLPYEIYMDYDLGRCLHTQSAEVGMERLDYLSSPHFGESLHELNGMVGMDEYKEFIRQKLCANEINKICGPSGKHVHDKEHGHFIFTGMPGTGKKTAAKVLGRVMNEYGIISRGQVIYRDETCLVGANKAETEVLVDELFDRDADGNVVMIIEPYTMLSSQNGRYALELIAAYTTNQSSDYIVLLCGYPTEMSMLLSIYPSLKEHCSNRFYFRPHKLDTVMEITRRMMSIQDYHFTPEAEALYREIVRDILSERRPDFSNGDWVKAALHDHIIPAQLSRLSWCIGRGATPISERLLSTIEREDVQSVKDKLREPFV